LNSQDILIIYRKYNILIYNNKDINMNK